MPLSGSKKIVIPTAIVAALITACAAIASPYIRDVLNERQSALATLHVLDTQTAEMKVKMDVLERNYREHLENDRMMLDELRRIRIAIERRGIRVHD